MGTRRGREEGYFRVFSITSYNKDFATLQGIKDKKLKGQLKREEEHIRDAVAKAAQWEVMLPETQGYAYSMHK